MLSLTYSPLFAWLVLWPALLAGVVIFRIGGSTPWFAYWSMRRLYCITRGRSNRWLVRWLGMAPRLVAGPDDGLLAWSAAKREAALTDLRRDGFVVLGQSLSTADIEGLTQFALGTVATLMPVPAHGSGQAVYEPAHPRAVKYDLSETEVIAHPVTQRLLTDPSLLSFARCYLGCEPVNDLVAMWWSTAHAGPANSEAAQLYHFDMDRPQFLKIFFYLTDVEPDTGPHCYIRGSHRERPVALWRDGRHEDQSVRAQYGAEREVEITAPAGTMIAVDTSGFHKGKPLLRGHRLILQIEYTSALFGQRFEKILVPNTESWRDRLKQHPYFLQRFSLS